MVLKNDAKEMYSYLEGIYELSPTLDDEDMPKWQIIGGTHEIEYESQHNQWRVRKSGSNSKLSTGTVANDGSPDDDNYKWYTWNDTSSEWIEAASGNVKIQGI